MATQSREDLKGYFINGATPDQIEFGDLIDSQLNLKDNGTQIVQGTISASSLLASSYNLEAITLGTNIDITESNTFGNSTDDIHRFTGSLHQSGGAASYFLNNLSVGTTSSFQRLSVSGSLFLNGSGHITASGNISSSGTLISDEIQTFGHITSSGNISSSNTILTKFLQLPQAPNGTDSGAIHFGGTADDNGFIYDDGDTLILGYNDTDRIKIHDTNPQVEIQGNLKVSHHITASGNISSSGTITANSFVGSLTTTGFDLDDNNKIKFGTGDDLQIFHDGSNSYISQSGVGNLIIAHTVQEKNIIFNTKWGGSPLPQTHLTLDGENEKTLFSKQVDVGVNGGSSNPDFYLFSNTNNQYIHWDASDFNLHFQDNVIASFGNGKDLQIKHDGSNSYIEHSGVGDLIIGNNNEDIQLKGTVEFKSQGSDATILTIEVDNTNDSGYTPKIKATKYGLNINTNSQYRPLNLSANANVTSSIRVVSDGYLEQHNTTSGKYTPIIARNIATGNVITKNDTAITSNAATYQNFKGSSNTDYLYADLTLTTKNPKYLVSAVMSFGPKVTTSHFFGRIMGGTTDGSEEVIAYQDVNDTNGQVLEIPLGQNKEHNQYVLVEGHIPSTLVSFTNNGAFTQNRGNTVRIYIQVRASEDAKHYFMNRNENNSGFATPRAFITVEEIPQPQ